MSDKLRHDNSSNNCTVSSDAEGHTRPHYWQWESAESNTRICTTCGRREELPKGISCSPCPGCGGTGKVPVIGADKFVQCPECSGSGYMVTR